MPINLYNPHLVFWEDLVSTTRNSDIMHNTKMRQGENKVLPVEKEPWKEDLVVQIKKGLPLIKKTWVKRFYFRWIQKFLDRVG